MINTYDAWFDAVCANIRIHNKWLKRKRYKDAIASSPLSGYYDRCKRDDVAPFSLIHYLRGNYELQSPNQS